MPPWSRTPAASRKPSTWLRRHGESWDMAIVDLFLEQGNGLGVVDACRHRGPPTRRSWCSATTPRPTCAPAPRRSVPTPSSTSRKSTCCSTTASAWSPKRVIRPLRRRGGLLSGVNASRQRLLQATESMSSIDFKGRVAIVTGAGGGWAASTRWHWRRAAPRWWSTTWAVPAMAPAVRSAPPQAVVDEIQAAGGEAIANGASVTDFEAVQAMVAQAVDTWGRVDILVNNAWHPARQELRQDGTG